MKSYTDIEQSKKLAEFLPIESADMHYFIADSLEKQGVNYAIRCGIPIVKTDIPCWSLVALMNTMSKEKGSCSSINYGYYDANGNYVSSWLCCYEKEGESTDDYIIETIPADNPIDCCYEMILKLKEKGLGPDRREWYEDDLEFEPVTKRVSLDKVCNFLIDNLRCSVDFDEYGNGTINESNWCSEKYNTISEFIEGLRKEFE